MQTIRVRCLATLPKRCSQTDRLRVCVSHMQQSTLASKRHMLMVLEWFSLRCITPVLLLLHSCGEPRLML